LGIWYHNLSIIIGWGIEYLIQNGFVEVGYCYGRYFILGAIFLAHEKDIERKHIRRK